MVPFRKLTSRLAGFGRLTRTSLIMTAALAPALLGAQVAPSPTVPITSTVPRALALDEAVRIAEAQSEAIRIARAGVDRAHGQQWQARSQLLPQITGSLAYTRTLASQFSNIGGGPAVDTTKPVAPPSPCDQYLRDATATTAERLAGMGDASPCALGGNPFFSFWRLGFGAKKPNNFCLSVLPKLFVGGRIPAPNAVADAGRRSAGL